MYNITKDYTQHLQINVCGTFFFPIQNRWYHNPQISQAIHVGLVIELLSITQGAALHSLSSSSSISQSDWDFSLDRASLSDSIYRRVIQIERNQCFTNVLVFERRGRLCLLAQSPICLDILACLPTHCTVHTCKGSMRQLNSVCLNKQYIDRYMLTTCGCVSVRALAKSRSTRWSGPLWG